MSRTQLWLVHAAPPLECCVWEVVVLAAIAAMETGRRFMAAALRRAAPRGGPVVGPGPELAAQGAMRAVADFWGRLHGFAQLGVPRRGWGSVGPHHPVLRIAGGGLQCVGPAPEV